MQTKAESAGVWCGWWMSWTPWNLGLYHCTSLFVWKGFLKVITVAPWCSLMWMEFTLVNSTNWEFLPLAFVFKASVDGGKVINRYSETWERKDRGVLFQSYITCSDCTWTPEKAIFRRVAIFNTKGKLPQGVLCIVQKSHSSSRLWLDSCSTGLGLSRTSAFPAQCLNLVL